MQRWWLLLNLFVLYSLKSFEFCYTTIGEVPLDMDQKLNRRQFLKTAGMVSGILLAPRKRLVVQSEAQIGAISDSFQDTPGTAEDILSYMQSLGLKIIELDGTTAEIYAGAPSDGLPPRHPESMTPQERKSYVNSRMIAQRELLNWRRSAPLEKFTELGEMFRDGGVEIDMLRLGSPNWFSEDIDYAYRAAKAVGARGVSFDLSPNSARLMAPFASEHNLLNGMHNHHQYTNQDFRFDEYLGHSPNNMLNLDIGNYVAAFGDSPVPVIEKYHDRITHLHLKDCKDTENGQDSVAWGEGDTPIIEVLQLLRDERYPIPALIELEYPIPEGSSRMEEMQKCVQYCKVALGS